jgi:hypothetical protein
MIKIQHRLLKANAAGILNSSKYISNYSKDQDNPYLAGNRNTIIAFCKQIAIIIANRL